MTTVNANEVALGIESFGDDDAPLVLLAGGTTMLLAGRALRGPRRRRAPRGALRPAAIAASRRRRTRRRPPTACRDLAADAVALADALGGGPAHLAGIGVGGMVAQVAALDHPGVFSALTLAGTRPVAPGPPDDDLPEVRRPAADRRHRLTMHFREWYAADPRRRVPEVDFGRVWTDHNHPHQQWSVSWNPGTGEPYTFNQANPQITVLAVFATALYGDFDTVSSANASGRRHVSDSGSSTRTGRRSALVHVRGGASELIPVR